MITAPHVIAGAAIGKTSNRWWLVLPIAFGSHFVLDYIPHVESTVLFNVHRGPVWAQVTVGTASMLPAITLTAWVLIGQPRWRMMLAGAVMAGLIDFLESVPGLEYALSTWHGSAWLYSFHHGFHHPLPHSQWPLGLTTQVVVVLIALHIARRGGKQARDSNTHE